MLKINGQKIDVDLMEKIDREMTEYGVNLNIDQLVKTYIFDQEIRV